MSQTPFNNYQPWTSPVDMPVMKPVDPQDDSYLEDISEGIAISPAIEADIVTNRIVALAQLIEAFCMTEGSEEDVKVLRRLAMDLLVEPAEPAVSAEESPHVLDNSDIE
jgi:hypothetical protein